jgi:predicted XRE-type DNA-binding protein
MPSTQTTNKPSHITTGNVLEDLGFTAQEIREMEIKHDLWVPIRAEIEAQKLTQTQLAKALQIHQPDASLLLRGQIERFSIIRLLQFAGRLRLAVTFSVAPMAEAPKARRSARIPMRKTARRRATKTLAELKGMRSVALG